MSLNQKGKRAGDWGRKTNNEPAAALAGPSASRLRLHVR